MNAQMIEHYFDVALTAPQGVKKLRALILTLAMQGKLVPQDPADQPAQELLKEIEAEKKRLVKEGKIKAPKPLPPITASETPYPLPKGWAWVRLGELGIWKSGTTPHRSNLDYYNGDIPWVKSGEVKQGLIYDTEEKITTLALDQCSLSVNPVGSILIAMYGANIGEVGILQIAATTNQAICAGNLYQQVDRGYLYCFLLSYKSNFIEKGAGAAQPNISREKIIHSIAPLPPLAEQRRIVEKVDQLMALCDALEQKIDAATQQQAALLAAVVAQA